MSTRGRFTVAWGLVLALAASVWWGIHPPRTEEAYRREAVTTTQRLASHLRTAVIWLESYEDGEVTASATTVALTEMESDADRDASGFTSQQPPNRETARLRARVEELAQQAVSLLGEARVDARAGRWVTATDTAEDLSGLSSQLLDLAREERP